MEFRSFGQTGLSVSAMGFGSWPMAGSSYGGVDQASAVAAVRRALEVGVNCFDTAPAYGLGEAEQMLGRALGRQRGQVRSSRYTTTVSRSFLVPPYRGPKRAALLLP